MYNKVKMDFDDNHSRTIIHIDLDCFYAQVEMLNNPHYQNIPLGIQQKNIVVTSNYKAREYGIKKCMLLTEAKKLCPELLLVNGEDLTKYRNMSNKVTNLLQTFTPLVERLGLDENYLDVTDLINEKLKNKSDERKFSGHIFGDLEDLCQCGCLERIKLGSIICKDIRESIYKELNLTSCGGIAHNKLLAKIVCSKHKPNDQTLVLPNNAVELMLSLGSISKIPGIGKAACDLLHNINILTVSDLQQCEISDLYKIFDREKAKCFKNMSFGFDNTAVKKSGKPLSIGLEDSFKLISAEKEVQNKIRELLIRLFVLVKQDGRIPKTIKITVRKYDKDSTSSKRETKQTNINSSLIMNQSNANLEKILSLLMGLFRKIVNVNKPFHITLLGLSFTKFQEKPNCNGLSSFLRKNIEVQSITNIENEKESIMDSSSSSSSTILETSDLEIEPVAKKTKYSRIQDTFCDSYEICDSPSKLKVADLHLSSKEKHDNNQNVCCPPDADKEVFNELPVEVQQEVWNNYKRKVNEIKITENKHKKARTNTLLNYFIKT